MNAINRIGQQVVCIDDDWREITAAELHALRLAGCPSMPMMNGVYTVSGFNPHIDPKNVYITLSEFTLQWGVIGFNIKRFRPLNPKNKHVEEMIKKLTTEKTKV